MWAGFPDTPHTLPCLKEVLTLFPHISLPFVDRQPRGRCWFLAPGPGRRPSCWLQGWARMKTVLLEPGWPLSLACSLLVSDFHWVNGTASANPFLGGGMVLAVAGDHLGAGGPLCGWSGSKQGRVTIPHCMFSQTGPYGMWGCDAGCCRSSEPAGGGQTCCCLLPAEDICRWALAGAAGPTTSGPWHTQRLQWE